MSAGLANRRRPFARRWIFSTNFQHKFSAQIFSEALMQTQILNVRISTVTISGWCLLWFTIYTLWAGRGRDAIKCIFSAQNPKKTGTSVRFYRLRSKNNSSFTPTIISSKVIAPTVIRSTIFRSTLNYNNQNCFYTNNVYRIYAYRYLQTQEMDLQG